MWYGTRGLGFGQEAVGEDPTANREVGKRVVRRFGQDEVVPSKAKGFRRAKPTKPESQVGETPKSEIPACGGRRGKPVASIEVGVKIAHVTIEEWQRGVTFITDARAHAPGVKRAADGVSRSTRLEKDALPFVQNGGGIRNHHIPGKILRGSRA